MKYKENLTSHSLSKFEFNFPPLNRLLVSFNEHISCHCNYNFVSTTKKQFKTLNRIVISYRIFETLYQDFPFLVLNLT